MQSLDEKVDALAHDHVFLGENHEENARRTLWVVGLTAVMMVGEIVAGLIFNSMALLADGIHMATHAGALAVAAGAYAFARRHAHNRRFTFGTGKVTDLAGFASALVLAIFAIGIAVESIGRLFSPQAVAFTQATIVAVLGLAVNLVSAFLLGAGHSHGHGHSHEAAHGHGRHEGRDHQHLGHRHADKSASAGRSHAHDNNMRSAIAHVLADALTSVLAIVALLSGLYLGWVWLDPVMGIVGSVVIASWAWMLVRDTSAVLLDTAEPALENKIRGQLAKLEGAGITDLHVWRIGPGAHAAIVSVVGKPDADVIRACLAPIDEVVHLTVETR